MYVCVCSPFTERQVRWALDQGADSVGEVFDALGHEVQCGKCVPTIRAMIREHRRILAESANLPMAAE